MLRKIIIAAAAATVVASTATVAYSQGRHHSGFEYAPYAPSYGDSYMHERSDPTNTNGN
jgi:hypothetical protein